MKVLIITPTPTSPATAGNRARVAALAAGLADAGHELWLAWVPMEDGDRVAMRRDFGARFVELAYRPPAPVAGRPARLLRRLWRVLGSQRQYLWGIDDWFDPGITPQLQALDNAQHFDVVIVEYVFLSKALLTFGDKPRKIIDTHDRFADRHKAYLRAGRRPEWFCTTPAQERLGLLRADTVIAIQAAEAAQFAADLANTRTVFTVGHAVPVAAVERNPAAPSAVFLASSNSINVEAARFFRDQVLPAVRAECPDFQLLLAGSICNVEGLGGAGVRLLGLVDLPAHAYAYGTIAINPVMTGTGLPIKTIECLAMGMPTIASRTGARGLPPGLAPSGLPLILVDDGDAQGFANAVLGLVMNPQTQEELRQAGMAFAAEWNAHQQSGLVELLRTPHPMPWQPTQGQAEDRR